MLQCSPGEMPYFYPQGRRTASDHLGGDGVLNMVCSLPSSKILDSKKSQDQARPFRWRRATAGVKSEAHWPGGLNPLGNSRGFRSWGVLEAILARSWMVFG